MMMKRETSKKHSANNKIKERERIACFFIVIIFARTQTFIMIILHYTLVLKKNPHRSLFFFFSLSSFARMKYLIN
jgi:hypothetical protein